MSQMSKKAYSLIAIVALMAFVAVTFFIRCYYHEPSGDEIRYQYVWEEGDYAPMTHKDHRYERKITSLGEIVQSQIYHYKITNGRSIVHAIEQAFTDRELSFSIVNTCVFLLFAWLIVVYSATDNASRESYPLWLFVLLCLLFLFPCQASLWTSVNVALNYLWPSMMAVGFLILWERIISKAIGRIWIVPIILFALIFGWTHEAFVVPLAGATFIYYCINFRKFRGQALALCIPFWISATIMVFAPANVNRFFHGGSEGGEASMLLRVTNGIDNMLHLCMLGLLVLGLIILLIRKNKAQLKDFVKKNTPLDLTFIVAFLFSLVANTATHSHTMLELTALLIICRYLVSKTHVFESIKTGVLAVFTLLFVVQQIVLVRDTFRIFEYQHEVVTSYKETGKNAYVRFYKSMISPTSKPFIRTWDHQGDFFAGWFTTLYGNGKDPMLFLKEPDMEAISQPTSFYINTNRLPGEIAAYKAKNGDYIWMHPDSVPRTNMLKAELYPVDWHHDVQYLVKLKFALFADSYSNTEYVRIDTIRSQYGTFYAIKPLAVRKIKSLHQIKESDKNSF